ncbi:restriction endonuclease subunit S [Halopseudomonas nanhaiensis]|uniref:restriction endonuclease subunit S n=1 Tax=Halopseudomonas nanhaiensis TaxID=2830842 RepID=UPI001CBE196E|nr:restriction endonuclease subunit S [Halopseudomonas nanhaiensis]UAW99806.1 restriction endonuclease subunit S [Halopseudomonas nanhaiensis]
MATDFKTLETVASVCAGHVFRGKAEAAEPSSGVRLLQIKDIREGLYEGGHLSWANVDPERLSFEFEGGELVIPLRGERSDVMYISDSLEGPTTAPNQVAVIRPNTKIIEPLFLLWYLNSTDGHGAISSLRIGTTVGHISVKNLKTISIPSPLLEDQKKIAAVYANWLERRKALRKAIELGSELSHGLCYRILNRGSGTRYGN